MIATAFGQARRSRAGDAGPARRDATRRLLKAAVIASVALVVAPASGALAASTVTITSPRNGSVLNHTPTFTGASEELLSEVEVGTFNPVTLRIYNGTKPEGPVVAEAVTHEGPAWTAVPTKALLAGTYTAQAEQANATLEPEKSEPVTFTIDTASPEVSLNSPPSGSSSASSSQLIAGSAGTAVGDLPAITVQLFAGSTIGSQAPLEGLAVAASGGSWSATFGGLSPGTYTARAEQHDEAGNTGISAAATFTLTSPPPPPPGTAPLASFRWFPSLPRVGEPVSLVSSSTDAVSPIASFAWALTNGGPFAAGKQTLTASFATPGDHVVRLLVSAADGLSSVATETIRVIRRPLTLMDPFPVVRIAGRVTSFGVSLSLLTVQAPVGARVRVSCRGRGCPATPQTRVASGGKGRATMVVIAFRRFQRSLAGGAVLEIRIFKPGLIGKFTSFVIRRGRLPKRVDKCLGPVGIKPIGCPSS
jgi:hypothetical protein